MGGWGGVLTDEIGVEVHQLDSGAPCGETGCKSGSRSRHPRFRPAPPRPALSFAGRLDPAPRSCTLWVMKRLRKTYRVTTFTPNFNSFLSTLNSVSCPAVSVLRCVYSLLIGLCDQNKQYIYKKNMIVAQSKVGMLQRLSLFFVCSAIIPFFFFLRKELFTQ